MDRKRRAFRRWHKRFGFFAAAFLVLLAATGILLNHSERFAVTGYEVRVPWLAQWYGIKADLPDSYMLGNAQLTANRDTWVLNARAIERRAGRPVGAVRAHQLLAVATQDALYLYLQDGSRVEKLTREMLPDSPIIALGTGNKMIVLKTPNGVFASPDANEWRRYDGQAVWSSASQLSAHQSTQLKRYFAPAVDALKLLQDLHSGRILGRYGPLLWDLVAIALILLSLSGLVIAYLSRRR